MVRQKGVSRSIKILIAVLIVVMVIFLAGYIHALNEIKANCYAPAPNFNNLISIFELPLTDSASTATYDADSCKAWVKENRGIDSADCFIKDVKISNSSPVITCHCWHKD